MADAPLCLARARLRAYLCARRFGLWCNTFAWVWRKAPWLVVAWVVASRARSRVTARRPIKTSSYKTLQSAALRATIASVEDRTAVGSGLTVKYLVTFDGGERALFKPLRSAFTRVGRKGESPHLEEPLGEVAASAVAAALGVAGAGRYDALVSCSTMFWMGFPGDADDEPLGADEKELGAACLRGLAAAVLKPRAVALVMTAGWYDWGHAFDEAIRGELLRDWLVLRRGCMVFHARSSGELVDLPFYCHLKSFRPIPPETERVILDEVELAMDYNDVAPELRDATRLVSVAPTFEKYLDRCGAGPFWLIRHDPPAAQRAVAESDLF